MLFRSWLKTQLTPKIGIVTSIPGKPLLLLTKLLAQPTRQQRSYLLAKFGLGVTSTKTRSTCRPVQVQETPGVFPP